MTVKEKLASLRLQMQAEKIDAYIVLDSDEHMSEYLPEHFRERKWISGFTGSAGVVVVTQQDAGLWTDGRYYLQAGQQLAGSGIVLHRASDAGVPSVEEFLCSRLTAGQTVGVHGRVASTAMVLALRERCAREQIAVRTDADLVGRIWTQQRPELPQAPAFSYPVSYAGESTKQKLAAIREQMGKQYLDSYIVGEIAGVDWLMNLRGSDVADAPLFTAFAMIQAEEAVLYADAHRLPEEVQQTLAENGVSIRSAEQIYEDICQLPGLSRVGLSAKSVNAAVYDLLGERVERVLIDDLCEKAKAVKNHVELQHLRSAHKHDGVALVRFLIWLEQAMKTERLTEWSICEKLLELRGKQPGFRGQSFPTIAGYASNGAIVHYATNPKTCAELREGSFLLVDSGGQYLSGTTDVTRTIPLGTVPQNYKRDFTLVLQSFISLHSVRFLEGSTGKSLDVLARRVMWENNLNYKHGTGHGVGFFLNVHEGPNNFAEAKTPLTEGMVISIEPGIYREGVLGIRTENLVTVVKDGCSDEFGQFYRFDPLTMCPINTAAIDVSMLSRQEIAWLNAYHAKVFEQLSPMLEEAEVKWLRNATAPIHVEK